MVCAQELNWIPDREFRGALSQNMVLSRRARCLNSPPQKQVSELGSMLWDVGSPGISSLEWYLTALLPAVSRREPSGVPAGPAPVPEHAAGDSAEPSTAARPAPAAGPGEPSAFAGVAPGGRGSHSRYHFPFPVGTTTHGLKELLST